VRWQDTPASRRASAADGRISAAALIWYLGRSMSATLRLPGLGRVSARVGILRPQAETRFVPAVDGT
jgi:hypothetical protein